jgi:hypothetical protein
MSVLIRLVRERLHHLVPAVAIEVGEFDMGAAAGPGECRRRHLLPRERSLAVIQEDQGLAGRGERDQVLVPVAFEIAGCERDGALASCCREERMAFPVFSGMRHTATDSGAGFQREAAPFWLRRFQRQKLKRARNAVRGNNASQPVSIAKPSMMLSYDSLETGTGSSNSLRSANESLRTDAWYWHSAQPAISRSSEGGDPAHGQSLTGRRGKTPVTFGG